MTMTTFERWYRRNAAEFNAKRRARYRQDKEYRQRIVERQAEDRARESRLTKEKKPLVKVDKNGNKQEVFRIGEVAQMLGRSPQTIRGWEAEGFLPSKTILSTHRYYTKAQISLMSELCKILEVNNKRDRSRLLGNWRINTMRSWEN